MGILTKEDSVVVQELREGIRVAYKTAAREVGSGFENVSADHYIIGFALKQDLDGGDMPFSILEDWHAALEMAKSDKCENKDFAKSVLETALQP